MYGSRNNTIRNFVLTFASGWIFGQVFTIAPKDSFNLNPKNASIQRSR